MTQYPNEQVDPLDPSDQGLPPAADQDLANPKDEELEDQELVPDVSSPEEGDLEEDDELEEEDDVIDPAPPEEPPV